MAGDVAMSQLLLEEGRAHYTERSWASCVRALTDADRAEPLSPDDLVLLSIASYLSGDDRRSIEALTRANRAFTAARRWPEVSRSAFWLAFQFAAYGDQAAAGGWAARLRATVEEHDLHGVEPAYLKTQEARVALDAGALDEALSLAEQVAVTGRALGDPDLETLALLTCGQVLMTQGHTARALDRLDQAMVGVAGDETSPPVAGLAYCAVISACMGLFDLARAREWTATLSTWCEAQPELVPYRGQCLVHRAQILTMQGAWPEAFEEAQSACTRLTGPAVGSAYYEVGELHRLRGSFADAEQAYRTANSHGRQPEPGLALLRLARGNLSAAQATLRRLYDEPGRLDRPEILAAYAEVMLGCGDPAAARSAAEELTAIAARLDSPLLTARARAAVGAVRCAEGDLTGAVPELRQAMRTFQALGVPYDAARVRVRIGDCLRAVGDADSASLEYDAALAVFQRLGAVPDLQAMAGATREEGGLTAREQEVLRLVAAGRTNRAIATELSLSEKTVARHVSNIYAKLELASRAAATAYAYEHDLV